ncbi:PAAR domain-containing protein [Pseudoduganella violaceinigra]|uniref:PAAR domain-containing protein n=1 Tax=Pseudoduganella violaceinigra TaxID=246602 RepID=UPI000485DC98|nr:PAAR domain-containing protein [Pseudoduganella violaceinigra]
MPNVIRVGDPTSHGGKVLATGAPYFSVGGKPVALVGDRCMCPMIGHQNCVIISGNSHHTINGKAVAYEGDKTSCGATLISTVQTFSSS